MNPHQLCVRYLIYLLFIIFINLVSAATFWHTVGTRGYILYTWNLYYCWPVELWATSHTRLRAHDHSTSSIFIGGKGGAGPSSLHTTLEGPTENISECKMNVKSTWIPIWHRIDHVSWSLGLFSNITSWKQA